MATPISDLRGILSRELNVPGFPQLPDISNNDLDSYLKDAFWEARLMGMLNQYTIVNDDIQGFSDGSSLPEQYQQLISIVAAMRIIRMKILNLAVNMRAKAGTVEFEQAASATTLRAVFQSMQERLRMLLDMHSAELGTTAVMYFDSLLQREASMAYGYMGNQVF